MKNIKCNEGNIEIVTEDSLPFGNISHTSKTILLDSFSVVSKELFQGNLNSMTIFMKDGKEECITVDDCLNSNQLENLFEFLMNQKTNNEYMLKILEITTMEEQLIK